MPAGQGECSAAAGEGWGRDLECTALVVASATHRSISFFFHPSKQSKIHS